MSLMERATKIGNQPGWLVITNPAWVALSTTEKEEEREARAVARSAKNRQGKR